MTAITTENTSHVPASPNQESAPPAYSVIITCYNDGAYIDDAVKSVQESTCRSFEIIIVDDHSNDPDTIMKLNAYSASGFKVINKTANKGVSDSRNLGIRSSRGRYILTLDADDRIHSTYLEKALTFLEKGSPVVYCNYQRFGMLSDVIVTPEFSFTKLLAGNYIVNCSPFSKQSYESAGGYDTEMTHYEDWEFWIRMAKQGVAFHHIDEVLFDYRAKKTSQNTRCSDPGYRSKVVEYVCRKHIETYRQHITDIIPYLHKLLSALENENNRMAATEKSIFGKLKRAFDKLGFQ